MRMLLDCSGLPEGYDATGIVDRAAEAYGHMLRPVEPGMDKAHARVLADGRTDPDSVRSHARNWNHDVLWAWRDAMSDVENRYSRADENLVGTPWSSRMAMAAMAVADMFHRLVYRHVCIPGPWESWPYRVHPAIYPEQKALVDRYPARFAVVEFDVVGPDGPQETERRQSPCDCS